MTQQRTSFRNIVTFTSDDKLRARFWYRVVSISYSAFVRGRSGRSTSSRYMGARGGIVRPPFISLLGKVLDDRASSKNVAWRGKNQPLGVRTIDTQWEVWMADDSDVVMEAWYVALKRIATDI